MTNAEDEKLKQVNTTTSNQQPTKHFADRLACAVFTCTRSRYPNRYWLNIKEYNVENQLTKYPPAGQWHDSIDGQAVRLDRCRRGVTKTYKIYVKWITILIENKAKWNQNAMKHQCFSY